MLSKGQELRRNVVEFLRLEDRIPRDHLLRKIDGATDFGQLYDFVEMKSLYREGEGLPSIDPVVLFKIVLIQHLYGIASLRQTMREVDMYMAYRWFLGYSLNDDKVTEQFPEIETVVADSAYKTPHICKKVFGDDRVLSTAYKRPQTMKGGHKWYEYVYDEHYDCIICPEYQPLKYSTTNLDGYREYKSDPKICVNCPTRHLCTRSKTCQKNVTRHIWKDYEELADDARYTPEYQDLYALRKQTIERVFADAKEKHAMRYTQYRGLAQVSKWVRLKFAAMNLKNWPFGNGETQLLPTLSYSFSVPSSWCMKLHAI